MADLILSHARQHATKSFRLVRPHFLFLATLRSYPSTPRRDPSTRSRSTARRQTSTQEQNDRTSTNVNMPRVQRSAGHAPGRRPQKKQRLKMSGRRVLGPAPAPYIDILDAPTQRPLTEWRPAWTADLPPDQRAPATDDKPARNKCRTNLGGKPYTFSPPPEPVAEPSEESPD